MPCQTLSSGLPLDGQCAGCRGHGAGGVSEIVEKRDELPEVASIEAYCVTLIKNLCYDSLRSCRPDEDSRLPEELNLPTDSNMVHEIEQKDEANQVKKLIGQLPRQQQQIILLRDVNDCSYEEIEQATGLTAVNIRVLLSRARKRYVNNLMNL